MKQSILPIPELGYLFNVRDNTTDSQAILECCKKQVYRKKGKLEIEAGDIWLDLGANVGGFSIHAAKQGALAVYAIEPEPENFELLRSNVDLSGVADIVKCKQAACVAGEQKTMDLYLCNTEKNKYRHTLHPTRGRKTIPVPCVNFQRLLEGGITAVKMDIEGAEMEILDKTSDWQIVRKLAFEYHFDIDRSVENFNIRMLRLEQHFPNVVYASIPSHITSYDFYPAAKIIHCFF